MQDFERNIAFPILSIVMPSPVSEGKVIISDGKLSVLKRFEFFPYPWALGEGLR